MATQVAQTARRTARRQGGGSACRSICARDEIVLIRQFRLPAHLANGTRRSDRNGGRDGSSRGELLIDAARRECSEEISVAPAALVELFTYLTTPGITDEEVTVFLAAVDASRTPDHSGSAPEGEHIQTVRRLHRRRARGARAHGAMRNGPLVIALAMAGAQSRPHRRAAGETLADLFDAGHFAARGLDARDRFGRRLDRHRHGMRIGVQQGFAVARDGDMAFPEYEIAAP